MRKKIIIGVILVLLLVLLFGAHLIYKNYKLGQELYNAAKSMSNEVAPFVDTMEQLEREYAKPDVDHSEINRGPFNYDITHTRLVFSVFHNNKPILDDVRLAYFDMVEQLFANTLGDRDNAKLSALFTDPVKANETTALKNQLNHLVECLNDFCEKYDQMSEWERCFTSWKNERKILTEQVRIP